MRQLRFEQGLHRIASLGDGTLFWRSRPRSEDANPDRVWSSYFQSSPLIMWAGGPSTCPIDEQTGFMSHIAA